MEEYTPINDPVGSARRESDVYNNRPNVKKDTFHIHAWINLLSVLIGIATLLVAIFVMLLLRDVKTAVFQGNFI
jgi:hypothetical protein